jgi:hypothetical protein
MSSLSSLSSRLQRIGLQVRPWDRSDQIFALDIQGDTFFLQEGEGNKVHIQATDRKLGQAVLMVHELSREFEVDIRKSQKQPRDVVVREVNDWTIAVRRKTPEAKRHLLIGRDERGHPFATQLRGSAVSVTQAHDQLKPEAVRGKRVKGKGKNFKKRGSKNAGKVFRQGEWFFSQVDQATQDLLNSRYWANLIERKVPIGPFFDGSSSQFGRIRRARGNPHTADEVLVYTANGDRKVYVRGRVRHSEHDTLKFPHWVILDRNTEVLAQTGISWVD